MLSDAAARGPRSPAAICARLAQSTQRAPRPALVCNLRGRFVGVHWLIVRSVGENAGEPGARERFATPRPHRSRSTRGAERTGALGVRARIADGVRGPRADASESTPCAVRAASCLSPHVTHSPAGSLSAVAAQGHAARRRLSERYYGVSANSDIPKLGWPENPE